MRNIISTFIKYPKIVTLLILAVAVFGYLGLSNLNSTFFPLETPRYIFIRTILPGAAPEEMEESIVLKIEEELKCEEEDDSDDEIEVKKFNYKGKEYLKDINDNTVYTHDGDVIGVYNEDTDTIDEMD